MQKQNETNVYTALYSNDRWWTQKNNAVNWMRFAMMCGATLSSTWIRFFIRPLVRLMVIMQSSFTVFVGSGYLRLCTLHSLGRLPLDADSNRVSLQGLSVKSSILRIAWTTGDDEVILLAEKTTYMFERCGSTTVNNSKQVLTIAIKHPWQDWRLLRRKKLDRGWRSVLHFFCRRICTHRYWRTQLMSELPRQLCEAKPCTTSDKWW